MKAPYAFDSDNLSVQKLLANFSERGRACFSRRLKPDVRPTNGARIGLRMETPIGWVVIFGTARGTHRESRHGRERAVVGAVFNDRVARAAVGAGDERVVISAVGRIHEFFETIRACCNVWRNWCAGPGLRGTLVDREFGIATRWYHLDIKRIDPRERRRMRLQF